jgi:carboxypeptidase PM20D1
VGGLSCCTACRPTAPDPAKKPVLITAHMDVVPVEAGTEGEWTHPPFGGEIADGFVWGRGTLDTKAHLIAALEAVERLLEKGLTPARDVYLAFGHDEELTGEQGARQIAKLLAERGLTFDFVLDEGGCVVKGALPGIEKPVALVGVGEKGFCNVRLTAKRTGATPHARAHTSVGVLAQAVCRLEAPLFNRGLLPGTRAFRCGWGRTCGA